MESLADLLNKYRELDGNRLSMVIDSEAKTKGQDGSSRSISTASDRSLLLHLRSLSGLIITDVATAEAENYKPSKFAPIQIWSKSGDFRGFEATPARGEHQRIDLLQTPDLVSAVAQATRQSTRLLFETGKTLSCSLASLGFIDELCLTISNTDLGEQAEQLAKRFAAELNLEHFDISVRAQVDGSTFFVMRS